MDQHYMQVALRLAHRHLGSTWPNPSVGCVIVKDGHVAGRGWTALGGRPHAETQALARAGTKARGATLYVTLEPCCHFGKTPPCTRAIITAGISRVVIASPDPDPRVSGKGVKALRDAGIDITSDICRDAADVLNEGYFLQRRENRPLVTLKLAATCDGKIALPEGKNPQITGILAQHYAHQMRASHDAIMVGVDTIISDDPQLTCRLPGLEHASPVRIVVDSKGRTPTQSRVLTTRDKIPTWVCTTTPITHEHDISLPSRGSRVDIPSLLQALSQRGVTRILLEGGSTLATSFLKENAVDRIVIFQSTIVTGGNDLPSLADLGIHNIRKIPGFIHDYSRPLNEDMMHVLSRSKT